MQPYPLWALSDLELKVLGPTVGYYKAGATYYIVGATYSECIRGVRARSQRWK